MTIATASTRNDDEPLGEINASEREAWHKTIEVQERAARRQVSLFPAGSMPCDDVDAIGVQLS